MKILAVSSIPYDKKLRFGKRFPDEVATRMDIPIFHFKAKHLIFYYLDFFLGILFSIPSFLYKLRKEKVDLIICFIPYLLPIAFLTKKPVIFVAVDDYEGGVYTRKTKKIVYKILKNIYFKKCTACISTTESVAKNLRILNKNTCVIRVGIDTKMFEFPEPDNKIPIIHYHGKLRANYNVDLIINAASFVKSKIKLNIVGDGPEYNNLRNLASEKDVDAEFFGRLPFEEIPRITALSNICILPIDLLAMKLYQYCAAGKPIIAIKGKQTEEILIDGKNALLTNKNPKLIAKKIDQILENPKEMQRLGQNAKEMIKDQDWSIIIPKFQKLIKITKSS